MCDAFFSVRLSAPNTNQQPSEDHYVVNYFDEESQRGSGMMQKEPSDMQVEMLVDHTPAPSTRNAGPPPQVPSMPPSNVMNSGIQQNESSQMDSDIQNIQIDLHPGQSGVHQPMAQSAQFSHPANSGVYQNSAPLANSGVQYESALPNSNNGPDLGAVDAAPGGYQVSFIIIIIIIYLLWTHFISFMIHDNFKKGLPAHAGQAPGIQETPTTVDIEWIDD